MRGASMVCIVSWHAAAYGLERSVVSARAGRGGGEHACFLFVVWCVCLARHAVPSPWQACRRRRSPRRRMQTARWRRRIRRVTPAWRRRMTMACQEAKARGARAADLRGRGRARLWRARRARSSSGSPPRHGRTPSPPGPRTPSPTGPGKGKRKGSTRCPICWKTVTGHASGLSQHQYWNENCNAWRIYMAGASWASALRRASRLKDSREEESYGLWAGASGMHGQHVTPAASKKHRMALDKGFRAEQREKKKKEKKKRKARPASSPTPEVERRRRRRSPTSSDGGDDVPRVLRVTRGPGRTFIVQC